MTISTLDILSIESFLRKRISEPEQCSLMSGRVTSIKQRGEEHQNVKEDSSTYILCRTQMVKSCESSLERGVDRASRTCLRILSGFIILVEGGASAVIKTIGPQLYLRRLEVKFVQLQVFGVDFYEPERHGHCCGNKTSFGWRVRFSSRHNYSGLSYMYSRRSLQRFSI